MLNTQVVHAAGPENIDPTSVINSTATNSANIGVSGTVVIDANGAKVLAEAGKQIGSHIGLAGVVGALTGATASVLKSASIPPMQKAGLIAVTCVAGAAIHTGATVLNKKLSVNINNNAQDSASTGINEGPSSPPSSFSLNSPLEEPALTYVGVKLYSTSSSDNSLEMVLYCIYVLNILNLFLLFLLTFSLVSKWFILYKNTEKREFQFLDKIVSQRKIDILNSIINKLLVYYSKSSTINIILTLAVIFICSIGSVYLLTLVLHNFDILKAA